MGASDVASHTKMIQYKIACICFIFNVDVVSENDELGDVAYSIAPPPNSEFVLKEEYEIESIPTEALVNELESRGWTVTLQKNKP